MTPKKRTTRSSPATTTTTTTLITDAQLKALIAQGVADVLAERDATRSRNGEDSHDSGMGVRRQTPLARECTYLDFMKCKPLYFMGTEGVVKLTQWFERMETVFCISNYTVENQIKFATCTLLRNALTWWNSHVRTVGHDVAYAITWTTLKKIMTDKYCPKGKIKKLEPENKKKCDNNNQDQQQPPKKQGVAIACTAGLGEKKESDCPELKNQNHRNQAREFPDRLYKVEKALYGLHQAPRAWKEMCIEFEKMMHKKFQMSSMRELTFFLGLQVTQKDDGIFISQDKYVHEILKKFGFSTVKTLSTPMKTSNPLMKDENAEDVDVYLYRSMISLLMYLISSRTDSMFVVCVCARFQVTPKVSHLYAVKKNL
nr:retrovirus-related Pol polyprotein from transposon TNT 1-94 [Tanacetum cinerariifolium]